ncbi:MAG: hypothetical protein FH749_02375 [Firmicutes bacterium]|nr:hypothetical protein [Bacillota bacterium]
MGIFRQTGRVIGILFIWVIIATVGCQSETAAPEQDALQPWSNQYYFDFEPGQEFSFNLKENSSRGSYEGWFTLTILEEAEELYTYEYSMMWDEDESISGTVTCAPIDSFGQLMVSFMRADSEAVPAVENTIMNDDFMLATFLPWEAGEKWSDTSDYGTYVYEVTGPDKFAGVSGLSVQLSIDDVLQFKATLAAEVPLPLYIYHRDRIGEYEAILAEYNH